MLQQLNRLTSNKQRLARASLILGIFAISMLYSLMRIMYQNYSVNKRIDTLRQEIAYLQQNNLEQENRILYYATDAYVEKTLREKLNYSRAGEIIYAVQRKDPEQVRLLREQRKFKELEDNKPNIIRWWDFFFGDTQEAGAETVPGDESGGVLRVSVQSEKSVGG